MKGETHIRLAFLVSKPLQLMTALNIIINKYPNSKASLLVIDEFSEAKKITENLDYEFSKYQQPIYFSSREKALAFLRTENFNLLYIDSDVGIRNFFKLAQLRIASRNTTINVYEEGIGTYRNNFYSGLKKYILKLIGCGTFFGGSRFIKYIYVYRPEAYIKSNPSATKKTLKISNSLGHFINTNFYSLKKLFNSPETSTNTIRKKHCFLYLSNWTIELETIEKFKTLEGDLFIKLHPHHQDDLNIDGIKTLHSRIPAELIIIDLLKKYEKVNIFDHNSSTRLYISERNLSFQSIDTLLNSKNKEEDFYDQE